MTAYETTTDVAIEHAIGESGSFSLMVASWEAQVTGVAGDTVRVRVLSGKLPGGVEIERGPDSFSVRQPTGIRFGGLMLGRDEDVRLGIEVPLSASVEIQTASGDVGLSGLIGSQHVRSASGDITVAAAAGALTVETMSGNVMVDLADAATVRVRSVSGDLTIRGGRADEASITTTSGDIRVLSPLGRGPHAIATVSGDAELNAAGRTGLRVTAKTVAGDLRTRLPHTTEGRPGRRTLVIGDGSTHVEFKSVSGDLEVLGEPGAVGRPKPDTALFPEPPQPPEPPIPAPAMTHDRPDGIDGRPTDEKDEAARLAILQALERGEIAIDEAGARLAALDGTADD